MTYNLNLNIPSKITKIESDLLNQKQVSLFIKRDDLIHPFISGNKWRKLKYNFQYAKLKGYHTILSYGGAYSNHLHALSYACSKLGFNSVGIVRGFQQIESNPTLTFCQENHMQLYYLDRSEYRHNKYSKKTLDYFRKMFNSFYMVPEGGNNELGVRGCEEILSEIDFNFDYVCSPVGTGCTAAGLIRSMHNNKRFLGFTPFKKVVEQQNSIMKFCHPDDYNNWNLISDIHFGGFGKINNNLVKFIQQFKSNYSIGLDLVYMGKLFYSLFNLISQNHFPKNTNILVLHTGGLQGLKGFDLY